MTQWTSDQLDKVGRAEEAQIASVGSDGKLRKPVTVWVVRHGEDLYVRVFSKTSHSSTPTMALTTKSTLPTGPSTADTPEASSTAC